jgi:hypothetical protein
MKRDIEQQLRDKRDKLDIEEPPKALWNNIRSEWQKPQSQLRYAVWWKVAAVLFLFSSIALLMHNVVLQHEVEELASLGDISNEYRQIENSYQQQINQLTSTLPLEQINDQEEYGWVMEELKQLEKINELYRKDIGKSVDQDRLVNALIDYYEKKIRILRKLQLEINRQQHEKEHTTPASTI